MNKIIAWAAASLCAVACSSNGPAAEEQSFTDTLLLKDYRPKSVFVLDEHHPEQAKYPVVDMHSHPYADDEEELREWVEVLDRNNVEKVIVYTYNCGDEFERLYDLYKGVSDKFEMWCSFNLNDFGKPDFEQKALADLERCYKKGAKGIGELGDKGLGESYCLRATTGTATPTAHIDDPVFDALFDKVGEYGWAVNVHLGDPIWMYEPIDNHNDGLMNAARWHIDLDVPGTYDLDQLIGTLENRVRKNPEVKFIACHFANYAHDYERIGELLDKYPNLFFDNAARLVETTATPRATKAFYEKYSDRIFFGTDNDPGDRIYRLSWRLLETEDEHIYASRSYPWPVSALGLSDECLRKVYRDNYYNILANN